MSRADALERGARGAPPQGRHERPNATAPPLLEVEALSVSFSTDEGRLPVVEDVSFRVHRGRMVGLVGESGCGKSVTGMTLLRLLPSPPSHVDGGRRFSGIPGMVPPPGARGSGCTFADRCAHVLDRCRVERPPLHAPRTVTDTGGHLVACGT